MAANRVGKTEGVGGYETTLHLTGAYPPWWEGRRFDRPVAAWVAGKTNETTRDIVQAKLFGRVEGSGARKRFAGTGLVPGDAIGACSWRGAFPDLADTVAVEHVAGTACAVGAALSSPPQAAKIIARIARISSAGLRFVLLI